MFVHHVFILVLSSIKALSTVKSDILSVENFIWTKKHLLSILIACIKTTFLLVICQQEYSFVQKLNSMMMWIHPSGLQNALKIINVLQLKVCFYVCYSYKNSGFLWYYKIFLIHYITFYCICIFKFGPKVTLWGIFFLIMCFLEPLLSIDGQPFFAKICWKKCTHVTSFLYPDWLVTVQCNVPHGRDQMTTLHESHDPYSDTSVLGSSTFQFTFFMHSQFTITWELY